MLYVNKQGGLYTGDLQPGDRAATIAETQARDALVSATKAIADIEQAITPRRLREAILTPEGRAWLAAADAQIAALRAGKG